MELIALIIGIAIVIFLVRIPMVVARRRDVNESTYQLIYWFSIAGIFLPFLWIASLIMSFVCETQGAQMKRIRNSEMASDSAAKLLTLREKGVLTQEEYENARKRLIK